MPEKPHRDGKAAGAPETSSRPDTASASSQPTSLNAEQNHVVLNDPTDSSVNYVPLSEPAATAEALADDPEGERLYQELKRMEVEAMQHPDAEDLLVQIAISEDLQDLDDLLRLDGAARDGESKQ